MKKERLEKLIERIRKRYKAASRAYDRLIYTPDYSVGETYQAFKYAARMRILSDRYSKILRIL